MKLKFTKAWISFLRLPLPLDVYKEVLASVHETVIPHLSNPAMLCDFLTKSYDIGGVVSVMALSSLFILMTQHGLEYPNFYEKIYALLVPSVFVAKHRLLDACLKSPLLPAYLAASFTKKLSRLSLTLVLYVDVDLSSTSSDCPGGVVKLESKGCQENNCKETVETIWKTVTDLCCSDSLKSFLSKRGRLTSLTVDKGVAIAELEFYTPQHVTRAEKSWKMIADLFQSVLGCNVEIQMNLVISACSPPKSAKAAASLFYGIFSCSRRMRHKSSYLTTSTHSDCASGKHALRSCQGNLLRASSCKSNPKLQ